MARRPRFFLPGYPLHIIQRGNNRMPIFHNDGDFEFCLHALAVAASAHGMFVHAYALMKNHVHLVATPTSAKSIPATMQSLGRRYVGWFNWRRRRTGTLWEGRYRATIIDTERYLFTCMRYVELNAVRAGAVDDPGDYRWSSYRANALGCSDPIVTPHRAYLELGRQRDERLAAYRSMFSERLTGAEVEAIRTSTNRAWVLGSEAFCACVEQSTRRQAAPGRRGRRRMAPMVAVPGRTDEPAHEGTGNEWGIVGPAASFVTVEAGEIESDPNSTRGA